MKNDMNGRMQKLVLFVCLLGIPLGVFAQLKIIVLSVGQSDSQILIGPDKTMVIDCGAEVAGSKLQYEYVAEKIRTLTGKSKIDYFVISHYHYDHIGSIYPNSPTKGNGLWGLLDQEGIKIDTIVDRGDDTPYGEDTGPYKNYKKSLTRWIGDGKLGQRQKAIKGAVIDLGGNVHVHVVAANGNGVFENLSPERAARLEEYPPSENDYSVVLKVSLGKFEYFTGGDVTGKDAVRTFPTGAHTSYNDIESSFANDVGNIEVMRVSHHGSEYSTNETLINTLRPEFSLVSSGNRNSYRHPTRTIIERLTTHDSKFFVTSGVSADWDGDPDMQQHIVGNDILIDVKNDGTVYTINGVQARSFTDPEEAMGVDHGNSSSAPLANVIPWNDAPQYLNQEVIVEGKIVNVRVLPTIAFLNFSSQYWKDLSLVITKDDFSKFGNLNDFVGKTVHATGTVSDYQGRPQIKLTKQEQLKIQ